MFVSVFETFIVLSLSHGQIIFGENKRKQKKTKNEQLTEPNAKNCD